VRKRSLIIIAVSAVMLGVLAAGVAAYDAGHREQIALGVTIGGIDVGGLTRAAAESRVAAELLSPLQQPIVIRTVDREWKLGPQEANITAPVSAMVEQALAASRGGWMLSRVVRDITRGRVYQDVPAPVTYSDEAVIRLIDRVRRALDRPAVDATLRYSVRGIHRVSGHNGRAVAAGALHRAIRGAIVTTGAVRQFVAPVHRVLPKITTAGLAKAYPVVLIINRGGFRLRLYKRLHLARTYKIAVGQAGLETPAGLYNIQWKQVDPPWHVPDREWAGKLRGKVIPAGDPRNPIKARWLAIYNGAGIHGTADDGSIGSAASHGCIRMHISDVVELYPQVPVGAPVYIA
jgi:lipoprotein-anchoring transpeptidase ErfK/SrfK